MVTAPRRPSRQPLTAAAQVGLWLAALAGLFAMHGLSDHGVGSHAMAMDHPAAAHGTMSLVDVGPALRPAPGSHAPGGATGLCVAVIALGLVLLASRRLRWPDRGLTSRLPSAGRRVLARARAPDPPDLTRLCIQRC